MSVSGFICTVKDPFLFFHCGHHQHTDWSLEITLSTLGWALKLVSPYCKMVALTLITASSHNRANRHKNIFCFFLERVKKIPGPFSKYFCMSHDWVLISTVILPKLIVRWNRICMTRVRLTWLALKNVASENQPKIWSLLINKEDKGQKVLADEQIAFVRQIKFLIRKQYDNEEYFWG